MSARPPSVPEGRPMALERATEVYTGPSGAVPYASLMLSRGQEMQ